MVLSAAPASASLAKSACRTTASSAPSLTRRLKDAVSPARSVVTCALGQWLVTWCVSHCRRLVSPPTTTRIGPKSAMAVRVVADPPGLPVGNSHFEAPGREYLENYPI